MDIREKCYIKGKPCQDLGEWYIDMEDVRNKLRFMAKNYNDTHPFYSECLKISENLFGCEKISTSRIELYNTEDRLKKELEWGDDFYVFYSKKIEDFLRIKINVMKRLSELYADNSLTHCEQQEILKDLSRYIKEFVVVFKALRNKQIGVIVEYHLDKEYYKNENSEDSEDSDEDD